jgi:hypothetical protein
MNSSEQALSKMLVNDRYFTVYRECEEILNEIEGLKTGHIVPSDGRTKADLLDAARKRLRRVEEKATSFGIDLTSIQKDREADFLEGGN